MEKVHALLLTEGKTHNSRNGKVLTLPFPVMTKVTRPMQMVNFNPVRDCNHVFHFMEAIWILAGRRDVTFLDLFNSNMKNYSDDGISFNASYGFRAIHHNGFDQLDTAIELLKKDPSDRRAGIYLCDPRDMIKDTKDVACNLVLLPRIVNGRLDLTIFNRSNDAIYGSVSGANVTQFGMILKYLAEKLVLKVGNIYTISNNLHVYLDLYPHWDKLKHMDSNEWYPGYPITKQFNFDCGKELLDQFCSHVVLWHEIDVAFESPLLDQVAVPMFNFWYNRKEGNTERSEYWLNKIEMNDWRYAITQWVERRSK